MALTTLLSVIILVAAPLGSMFVFVSLWKRLKLIVIIVQATKGWDPGVLKTDSNSSLAFTSLTVTGLGTPNFGKLKELIL